MAQPWTRRGGRFGDQGTVAAIPFVVNNADQGEGKP